MSAGFTKISRYRFDSASAWSAVPGSVIAMKWRPACAPSACVMRAQKKRSSDATSTVPPLLLATRNSVRAGSMRAAAPPIVRSSVVSSTKRSGCPVRDAEHRSQHFGAQAAAAHAEQVDRVDLFSRDLRQRACRIRSSSARHRPAGVEPAEPRADRPRVGAALGGFPDTDVAIPDARDDSVAEESIDELGRGRVGDGHAADSITVNPAPAARCRLRPRLRRSAIGLPRDAETAIIVLSVCHAEGARRNRIQETSTNDQRHTGGSVEDLGAARRGEQDRRRPAGVRAGRRLLGIPVRPDDRRGRRGRDDGCGDRVERRASCSSIRSACAICAAPKSISSTTSRAAASRSRTRTRSRPAAAARRSACTVARLADRGGSGRDSGPSLQLRAAPMESSPSASSRASDRPAASGPASATSSSTSSCARKATSPRTIWST